MHDDIILFYHTQAFQYQYEQFIEDAINLGKG